MQSKSTFIGDFSLIELLVVVAIISLLAAILFPSLRERVKMPAISLFEQFEADESGNYAICAGL